MADKPEQRPVLPPPPQDLADGDRAKQEAAEAKRAEREAKAAERERAKAQKQQAKDQQAKEKAERERVARLEQAAAADRTAEQPAVPTPPATRGQKKPAAPRRTRKAQLRLVQVDAWSVMKTAFLLSIALGIVLVVAVAIVWSVLGAAGVWDSINSIVQQAVGSATGPQFDITDYLSTSRVLGVAMIVAALDVVLITAIATLGAFLYNLSAALLGGVEVTLAEDN